MNSFRSASAATEIVLSASTEYKVYSMGNVTTIFPGLEKCLNEFGKRLGPSTDFNVGAYVETGILVDGKVADP